MIWFFFLLFYFCYYVFIAIVVNSFIRFVKIHENQKCNEKHWKNIVTFLCFSLHFCIFVTSVKKKKSSTKQWKNTSKTKTKQNNNGILCFDVFSCCFIHSNWIIMDSKQQVTTKQPNSINSNCKIELRNNNQHTQQNSNKLSLHKW